MAKHYSFYWFTFRLAKSNLEHNGCIADLKVWIGALPALFSADRFEGTIVVMKGVKMAIMTDMRDRTMCWELPHSLWWANTLHTAHCTLHTACCTLNAARCTLYIAHFTLSTTHRTLHTENCILDTKQCTLQT